MNELWNKFLLGSNLNSSKKVNKHLISFPLHLGKSFFTQQMHPSLYIVNHNDIDIKISI